MNINTLQVTEYKGCKIYVRNFGTAFEYLAVVNGELYTTHIKATKKPLQWILGKPWTQKQLEDMVKFLLPVAQATIDTVLEREA